MMFQGRRPGNAGFKKDSCKTFFVLNVVYKTSQKLLQQSYD